nr:MAG TPA: hypothetical protein [Caudoviricetes sp.]
MLYCEGTTGSLNAYLLVIVITNISLFIHNLYYELLLLKSPVYR